MTEYSDIDRWKSFGSKETRRFDDKLEEQGEIKRAGL